MANCVISSVYIFLGFLLYNFAQVNGGVCQGDPLDIISMCQDASITSAVINLDTSLFSSKTPGGRCTCNLNITSDALFITTLHAPTSLECGTAVTFKMAHNPKIECGEIKEHVDTTNEKSGIVEISTTSSSITDSSYCIQLKAERDDDLITMICHQDTDIYSTETPPLSVMEELLKQNNQSYQAIFDEMNRNPEASVLFEPLVSPSELEQMFNESEKRTENTTLIPSDVVTALLGNNSDTSNMTGDTSTVIFEPVDLTTINPPTMENNSDISHSNNLHNDTEIIPEVVHPVASQPNNISIKENNSISDNFTIGSTQSPKVYSDSPLGLFNQYVKTHMHISESSIHPSPSSTDVTTDTDQAQTSNTGEVEPLISSSVLQYNGSVSVELIPTILSPSENVKPFKTEMLHSTQLPLGIENTITSSLPIESSMSLQDSSLTKPLSFTTSDQVQESVVPEIFNSILPSSLAIEPAKSDAIDSTKTLNIYSNTTSSATFDNNYETSATFDNNSETTVSSEIKTDITTMVSTPVFSDHKSLTTVSDTTSTTVSDTTSTTVSDTTSSTVSDTTSSTVTETTSSTVSDTTSSTVTETTSSTVSDTTGSTVTDTTSSTMSDTTSSTISQSFSVTEHVSPTEGGTTVDSITTFSDIQDLKSHSTVDTSTEITDIDSTTKSGTITQHIEGKILHDFTTDFMTSTKVHDITDPVSTTESGTTERTTTVKPIFDLPTEETVSIEMTTKGQTTTTKHPPMKILPKIPKVIVKSPPKIFQEDLDHLFNEIGQTSVSGDPTLDPNTGESLGTTEGEDVLSEETVTIIVIGSVIGIVVLIAVIVILTTILQSKRRASNAAAAKDVELNGKGIDNPLMELETQHAETSLSPNGNGTIHEEPEAEHNETSDVSQDSQTANQINTNDHKVKTSEVTTQCENN